MTKVTCDHQNRLYNAVITKVIWYLSGIEQQRFISCWSTCASWNVCGSDSCHFHFKTQAGKLVSIWNSGRCKRDIRQMKSQNSFWVQQCKDEKSFCPQVGASQGKKSGYWKIIPSSTTWSNLASTLKTEATDLLWIGPEQQMKRKEMSEECPQGFDLIKWRDRVSLFQDEYDCGRIRFGAC